MMAKLNSLWKNTFFPWSFVSLKKRRVAWSLALGKLRHPEKGLIPNTPRVSMFRCHFWRYIPYCGQKSSLSCPHPIVCRVSGAFCWFKPNSCWSTQFFYRWETNSLIESPVPVDTRRVRANASSNRRLMLYFWLSEGPAGREGSWGSAMVWFGTPNFRDKPLRQSVNS